MRLPGDPVSGPDRMIVRGVHVLAQELPAASQVRLATLPEDPDAPDTFIDYLARRADMLDRQHWVIRTRSWAFDFGRPTTVVDTAMDRLTDRFRPSY